MAIIDDLRDDWTKQHQITERQIALLEGGGRIRRAGQDAEEETAVCLDKLRHFRSVLEQLLAQFPGER